MFLFLLSLAVADVVNYPLWPDTFTQTFNETFKYPGGSYHYTTGTFYYNWTARAYRVDRANGRYDRYCGLNGSKMWKNTPCSHYVSGGDRYLYYPVLDECCYCCSSEHGCGILRPDWMNNGTFLGQVDHLGISSYKWDKQGLQHNYYFETVADNPLDRVMLGIYQEPNDFQDFQLPRGVPIEDDFVLPSKCKKNHECSLMSTCTLVRHAAS